MLIKTDESGIAAGDYAVRPVNYAAKLHNIPVRLLNTLQPEARGTLIDNNPSKGEIKAVAAKDNITAIKIKSARMLLAYDFYLNVFKVFDKYKTPVDMIVTSEVGVSVTIDNDKNLDAIVDELMKFSTVTIDKDMVIVCAISNGAIAVSRLSRSKHSRRYR